MMTIHEQYGAGNVTVLLEWTQKERVSYNLTIISPNQDRPVRQLGNNRAQLILSYNKVYRVMLVANLCGRSSSNKFDLHYGECIHL